ncbi:tetratricopeptide repeat protein [Clostridium cylindrosporum]|uniref:Uncharacterized protein n=1 Tax=Clostridium cylindrosporum DSM 605 TaxID=1121307 RepID=A0A0J8DAJ3_CLOCY|nr:hypothetical protein [Clostridium cylindrosporum]KMT22867.1 hypothetical protein CLCY_5c01060 [Clostridium cylindrosporum DSM 605]
MSNTVFVTILIFAILFNLFFILFGYFKYKKEDGKVKKFATIFLAEGILLLGIYIGLIIVSNFYPSSTSVSTTSPNGSKVDSLSTSVTGLKGSLGNGINGTRGVPSDPKVEAILTKGDTLLSQNDFEGAVKEFKVGLREETYKDMFQQRIDYTRDMKRDYMIYIRGLNFFNNGKYDKAYNEFKTIKPNELIFYSDVEKKMGQISSGMLINPLQNQGTQGADSGAPQSQTMGAPQGSTNPPSGASTNAPVTP